MIQHSSEHIYSRSGLVLKYLQYYFSAGNSKGHGAHSPFLFSFITDLLNDKKEYPEYRKVEQLRSELLKDKRIIEIADHGAGSSGGQLNRAASVAAIAKQAAKPKKYGQLLFRMVRAWKPGTILEFGTSLGITTSYLSLGNTAARVITMEGAPAIAGVAMENLRKLSITNAKVLEGVFDSLLPSVIRENPKLDFVFIDGNHRYAPTVKYFRELLPFLHNDSVIVFDDIHWSNGMEMAWEEIKNEEAVRCSIDLFFIGAVFFRKEFREKQHFTIRF